jgi:hypothetical protein
MVAVFEWLSKNTKMFEKYSSEILKLSQTLVGNYNCSELNLSVQTALEIIKTEELLKK